VRVIERARRIVLIAVLCAGAFLVPFGIAWWLDRNEPAETPPRAAVLQQPTVAYPLSGLIGLAEESVASEPHATTTKTPRPQRLHSPPALIDEVRAELKRSFYLPISDSTLGRPSIGQIIDAIGDPYTEYLWPSEFKKIREEAVATYDGVGLLVVPADAGLIVTSALRGPARDAGVRPGDLIISIDGVPVDSLAFERAISLFRGELGTIVTLTIERPGDDRPRLARVVRQAIDEPAIRVRTLNTEEQNLGYIRLLSFTADAGNQVLDATNELLEQGIEGIVLDLRGNPGGYLLEAIKVASVFLDTGIICSTDGLHRSQTVYTASGGAIAGSLPLVTLVDGQSASAAEIVAAAMLENKRGQVVGTSTFGKASVQSLVPLDNGGGLRLTTATYRTPLGNRIAGHGVRPHIESLDDPLTRRDEGLRKARGTLAKLVELRFEPPEIHF